MPGLVPSDLSLLGHVTEVRLSPTADHAVFTVRTVDLPGNTYRCQLWLADVDGGRPARPLTLGNGEDHSPRWSPDGRQVAFLSTPAAGSSAAGGSNASGGRRPGGAPSPTTLCVITPTAPGDPVTLASWPDEVGDIAWAPDGGCLAVIARRPDPRQYGPEGRPIDPGAAPPRRVTTLLSRLNGVGWVHDRPHVLWLVTSDGSTPPRCVTDPARPVEAVAWSPDSTRLAYVAGGHPGWDLDLCNAVWILDLHEPGAVANRLTASDSAFGALAWSPDGRSIAALRTPTPLEEPRHGIVSVIDVAGRSTRDVSRSLDRNAAPHDAPQAPVWSGTTLLFAVEERGAVDLYRVDADGRRPPISVIAGAQSITSWDVVGSRVAYVASRPMELAEAWVRDGYDGEEAGGSGGEGRGVPRRLSDVGAELAARVELAEPVHFVAVAPDGAEVDCWAMVPLTPMGTAPVGQSGGRSSSPRFPTILNIHGGPFGQYGYGFFDEFQYQVAAGFGVIYCNPRGSSGRGESWGRAIRWPEADHDPGSGWGGVDYVDVMACVDEAVRRFAWIDPDRLGVQGGSYGGYLTSWIVAHTDRFQAACSERAANDLLSVEYHSDIAGTFRAYVGHTHLERPDLYRRQSPSELIERMTTPLLLVHSEDDLRCPIDQAEELFVGLRLLGRHAEMVRFPGEDHELSRSGSPLHRLQRTEIILDWFRTHLGT